MCVCEKISWQSIRKPVKSPKRLYSVLTCGNGDIVWQRYNLSVFFSSFPCPCPPLGPRAPQVLDTARPSLDGLTMCSFLFFRKPLTFPVTGGLKKKKSETEEEDGWIYWREALARVDALESWSWGGGRGLSFTQATYLPPCSTSNLCNSIYLASTHPKNIHAYMIFAFSAAWDHEHYVMCFIVSKTCSPHKLLCLSWQFFLWG